jgi:hypothetical protein
VSLQPYIATAIAEFPKGVTPELVARACSHLGISQVEFCDMFAKEAAHGYLDGSLTWRDADSAMNALSGFFFLHLPKGAPFPDYAYGVFLAFDAGEVFPEPDNERATKEQLASLHAKA